LEASYQVEKIVIKNRWCNDETDVQNQCLCRLSNADLILYDSLEAVVSSFSLGDTCGRATIEYINPPKLQAKYLKISVPGNARVINIFEVQVFDYTGSNRALGSSGAVASQSSTISWNGGPCEAFFAIDGGTVQTNGVCQGLAHTSSQQDPWWQVNMQNLYEISRVVIYNRVSYLERLANADVSLMDQYENVIGRVADIGDTQGQSVITLDSADFVAVTQAPSKQPTSTSKIQIADGACSGAQSFMSMTGHSAVSNTSCLGPQSCTGMHNGTALSCFNTTYPLIHSLRH
jgi:hypothetical protein